MKNGVSCLNLRCKSWEFHGTIFASTKKNTRTTDCPAKKHVSRNLNDTWVKGRAVSGVVDLNKFDDEGRTWTYTLKRSKETWCTSEHAADQTQHNCTHTPHTRTHTHTHAHTRTPMYTYARTHTHKHSVSVWCTIFENIILLTRQEKKMLNHPHVYLPALSSVLYFLLSVTFQLNDQFCFCSSVLCCGSSGIFSQCTRKNPVPQFSLWSQFHSDTKKSKCWFMFMFIFRLQVCARISCWPWFFSPFVPLCSAMDHWDLLSIYQKNPVRQFSLWSQFYSDTKKGKCWVIFVLMSSALEFRVHDFPTHRGTLWSFTHAEKMIPAK